MFPVVDEYHFTEMYRKYRGCEQFMEPDDFMVYQAIVAAGFGGEQAKPNLNSYM